MEYVNGGEVSNRRVLSWLYYYIIIIQFKINKNEAKGSGVKKEWEKRMTNLATAVVAARVGLDFKAEGLQGECSTHGLTASLN